MKKILTLILVASIFTGCSRTKSDHVLPTEGQRHQTVEQKNTIARNQMWDDQAVAGEYNDQWVYSHQKGTRMHTIDGDSWVNYAGTSYIRHALAAENAIIRGVGGTDYGTNDVYASRSDTLYKDYTVTRFYELVTNDIGIYGKLDTNKVKKYMDKRIAASPYAHHFMVLCPPHPKHIELGHFWAILDANDWIQGYVAAKAKTGLKIDYLDAYTLFSLPGQNPRQPHPDVS
jgi:hypothetical protein